MVLDYITIIKPNKTKKNLVKISPQEQMIQFTIFFFFWSLAQFPLPKSGFRSQDYTHFNLSCSMFNREEILLKNDVISKGYTYDNVWKIINNSLELRDWLKSIARLLVLIEMIGVRNK